MSREQLGEFEHQVLLAVLRHGGESYSVPIVEELESRTGRDVAPAAVYIVLRRLEDKGLLTSRFEEEASTGRTRRYFAATPAALEKLRESRRTMLRLWEGLDELAEES